MEYYVSSNGSQTGPLPEAEIIEALKAGRFLPTDLGIEPGKSDWRALSEIFPDAVPSAKKGGCRRPLGWFLVACGILILCVGGLLAVLVYRNMQFSSSGLVCKLADESHARVDGLSGLMKQRGLLDIRLDDSRRIASLSREDRELLNDFQDAIKIADSNSRSCGMAKRAERTMQIETAAVVFFGLIVLLLGFVLRRKPKQA
ncbi:MAG: DUF4339 domain-containing protein [Acidobacteria bacterium ACB1]|nr:DUF4339 domain-containing protein [Acidobacteria bacterium ACB1]